MVQRLFVPHLIAATSFLTAPSAHAQSFTCDILGVPSLKSVEIPEGEFGENFELGRAQSENGLTTSILLQIKKTDASVRDGEPVLTVRFIKGETSAFGGATLPLGGVYSRKPGGTVHAWLNVGNALVPEIFEERLPEARRFESAGTYRKRLADWLKTRPESLIRASLGEVVEVVCKPR